MEKDSGKEIVILKDLEPSLGELTGALDSGALVKLGDNGVVWDDDPSNPPSDKEVLAALGLNEDGSPTKE